jgi:hypothetical protein
MVLSGTTQGWVFLLLFGELKKQGHDVLFVETKLKL